MQVRIAAEEDEIKKQYWNILKKKYLNHEQLLNDPKLRRKIRIIKERGTNVQMPQSKVPIWKFYYEFPFDLRKDLILARLPNFTRYYCTMHKCINKLCTVTTKGE